jgi:hypothetical protein
MKKIINFKSPRGIVLLVTLGMLVVSSILVTIETATSGVEFTALQKEEAQLLDQKRYLQDSLVKSLSISQLQEEGVAMGYVKPTVLVYATVGEPVAKLP